MRNDMSNKPTINTPPQGRAVAVVGDVYRFLATGSETSGKYSPNMLGEVTTSKSDHVRALTSPILALSVNTRAPLVLAHRFGRKMRERRRGGMIFLASTVAFAGVPGMSAYSASKSHALTFAEGFAREVANEGIAVLALCAGPTSTDIWPSGATPTLPMRPDAVAEVALRRLGRRTTVVAGLLNRLITFSTRFAPRWMNSLIFGKVVGGMLKNASTGATTAMPVPTISTRTSAPTG